MIPTNNILIPGIVGTSAMTVFSYMVSESKKRNFREPEVLGQLIARLPARVTKEKALLAGWGLHYAIGVIFMTFFNGFWKHNGGKPSLLSGAKLGAASGLIGTISWKGMFEIHANPPAKNLKRFFGHLILAHVVFGVFCSLAYKWTLANKKT